MMQRIVLFGTDAARLRAAESAAVRQDVLLLHTGAGKPMPPFVSGICVGDPTSAALSAMLAVGAEHNAVLLLLAEAIDSREDIPPGAAARVAQHAARFGQALGLAPEEVSRLERAALLRGIGKLRIGNATLLKQSVLDYDDWILLQSHTTLGAELLAERGVCPDVAEIVHCYHENWDGAGYPQGLEGESIPRLARALHLVDVYCAMTSPRLYRKGYATPREAGTHLKAERGKQFDPAMVDVFAREKIGSPWK